MEAPNLKEAPAPAPVHLPAHGQAPHAPPAHAPAAPKGRNPKKAFAILGLVAVVVVGSVGGHALLTAGEVNTDNAQVESDVVPLSSRVPGVVKHLTVKEDQEVHKGDVILELDDADFSARVKAAEADLATAQAQADAADAQAHVVEASARGGYSSARAMVSGSSAQVGSAEAQIAAAKAQLQKAETDQRRADLELKRSKELRAANAIPQERLDNAQLAFDASQAALEAARAQVKAAEEGRMAAVSRTEEARGRLDQQGPVNSAIAVARANAAVAHARVQAATAGLELAKLQLSYTKVLAPADGFVSKLGAREGQLIQPGQAIAELVPSDTYVVANFKETQIGTMHAGDRAEIEIDAFPGRKFEGSVASLSGGTGARFSLLPPDNASGNFVKVVQRVPVRIAWSHPPDVPMRPGLSAEVVVHAGR